MEIMTPLLVVVGLVLLAVLPRLRAPARPIGLGLNIRTLSEREPISREGLGVKDQAKRGKTMSSTGGIRILTLGLPADSDL